MQNSPSPRTDSTVEPQHPDRGAARIYAAVFRQTIPEMILERFVQAATVLDRRTSDEERVLYDHALKRIGDLEALELAARYTHRVPALSDRFRLMVYIVETDPDHQHYYVGSQTGFVGGLLSMVGGGFQTTVKLIKGWFLLKRLGHA